MPFYKSFAIESFGYSQGKIGEWITVGDWQVIEFQSTPKFPSPMLFFIHSIAHRKSNSQRTHCHSKITLDGVKGS